jgi:hypothetical protein
MHPAGANARNARDTEVSGTETNASGNMAGCVIKPGQIVKCLGFVGVTVYCVYNGSGIILTGRSRNNTAGINKTFNCNVCSGTLSLDIVAYGVPYASMQVIKHSNVASIDWNLLSGMNIKYRSRVHTAGKNA